VAGLLTGSALAQTQDVGDHAGAFLGEGLGGEADGTQKIRVLREMGPQARVLFVEADRREDGAGLGFGAAGDGRCRGVLHRRLLRYGAVA
jgi:hypothetical protein